MSNYRQLVKILKWGWKRNVRHIHLIKLILVVKEETALSGHHLNMETVNCKSESKLSSVLLTHSVYSKKPETYTNISDKNNF